MSRNLNHIELEKLFKRISVVFNKLETTPDSETDATSEQHKFLRKFEIVTQEIELYQDLLKKSKN